jgi:uncharacterized protein
MNSQKQKMILRFIGWFFLINSVLFWIAGYGYLRNILLSPSLFENSLADYSSLAGKILIVAFSMINYLSYMMLLAYIPAVLILILAFIVSSRRFIFTICVLIASASLMLLIINNCIYSMFKFHLNMSLVQLIFNGQWYDVFDFSTREVVFILSVFALILCFEACIAFWVWKKIIVARRFQVGRSITVFWLGGFLFSYFTLLQSIAQNNNLFSQQTPNLPFYNQLLVYLIPDKNAEDILYRYSEDHFSQPLFSNDPLNYPLHPLHCTKSLNPPNIIIIMVDSLRFDSVQPHYMPELTKFAAHNWQFQQHVSGGNSTQPGLFSLFYSIPSSYWTAALEQKVPPVLMQLLLQYGYLARVIWSSEMLNPPFDKTIYAGITHLNPEGAPGNDIGNRDRYVSQEAIKFLNEKQKQPFFLNLFYDAPHGYCRDQSFPAPYQPAIKECSRIAMTNEINPLPYYNRYLNTVRFVDGEIAKVLAHIEQQGYLSNSIVIITSDHGQEFNDNKQNYWGHAGNFTLAQVHVPLIIHWPGKSPGIFNYLTSSYDVVPTLLQELFHCDNPVIDYSIGQNLLKKEDRLPFILSGSYSNMGIIEPDRLTTLRTSGGIAITNAKAEPEPKAKPRMDSLKKALELMRLYFK